MNVEWVTQAGQRRTGVVVLDSGPPA